MKGTPSNFDFPVHTPYDLPTDFHFPLCEDNNHFKENLSTNFCRAHQYLQKLVATFLSK
jgi:hypothetical protein